MPEQQPVQHDAEERRTRDELEQRNGLGLSSRPRHRTETGGRDRHHDEPERPRGFLAFREQKHRAGER